MTRLSFAALAAFVMAGTLAAQEGRYSLPFADASRFIEIREGKRLVKDPNAAEAKKNDEIIRKKAQVEINRFQRSATTSSGTGSGNEIESISDYIRSFASSTLVDPLSPVRKLSEGQLDLIRILGQEMTDQLVKFVGTKEKPSGADIVVKVNAARMLSVIARSGYEGVGEAAVNIVNDPQQLDAVKLYALEALHNLFAVPNPERPERSVFTKPEMEVKAVTALIDFIARKPAISAATPHEEVDAYKFVRREAVRALGKVRKPAFRDSNTGAIVANPAIWLLRVANADRNLVPPPSLNERVDALAGYLVLAPDKEQNMDYAAGFVGTTIRDLTLEFKERKSLDRPSADAKPSTDYSPVERDYHPWRVTATRISLGLKNWLETWSDPVLGARPADVKAMMTALVTASEDGILKYMADVNKGADITLQPLEDWLRNTKFASPSLFPNDPKATIVRPDAAR